MVSIVDQPSVEQIVETIVEALHPNRIILFGSRARGQWRPDSDVDLMIELETDLPFNERALRVYSLFHPRRWSMDVVVYTPTEASQFRQGQYSLLREIERTGRVVYERKAQ